MTITVKDKTGYTPEQRRIINAQLAEGLEDIRAGRVSPRFNTVDEILASLKSGRKTHAARLGLDEMATLQSL